MPTLSFASKPWSLQTLNINHDSLTLYTMTLGNWNDFYSFRSFVQIFGPGQNTAKPGILLFQRLQIFASIANDFIQEPPKWYSLSFCKFCISYVVLPSAFVIPTECANVWSCLKVGKILTYLNQSFSCSPPTFEFVCIVLFCISFIFVFLFFFLYFLLSVRIFDLAWTSGDSWGFTRSPPMIDYVYLFLHLICSCSSLLYFFLYFLLSVQIFEPASTSPESWVLPACLPLPTWYALRWRNLCQEVKESAGNKSSIFSNQAYLGLDKLSQTF